jgi:hypothetical protein
MANVFLSPVTTKGGGQPSAPSYITKITVAGPADYATNGTPFIAENFLPLGATLVDVIARSVVTATGKPGPSDWEYDVTAKKLVAYVRTTGVEVANAVTTLDDETLHIVVIGS